MDRRDTFDLPEPALPHSARWHPRTSIDGGDSPLLWRLALAAATAIVALAAAGSLLA